MIANLSAFTNNQNNENEYNTINSDKDWDEVHSKFEYFSYFTENQTILK